MAQTPARAKHLTASEEEKRPDQGNQKTSTMMNVVASSSQIEYRSWVNAVRSTISQKFEKRGYGRWLRTEWLRPVQVRPPDFLTFAGKSTVVNDGVPDGRKSAYSTERIRPNENTTAGCHSETGTRVIAERKGIKQLEKINEGRREQFFPEGFHPQPGHDRDEIELFVDQFLLQRPDHSRFELNIRIQKQNQFGMGVPPTLLESPKFTCPVGWKRLSFDELSNPVAKGRESERSGFVRGLIIDENHVQTRTLAAESR